MLITTTDTLQGREIKEYLGIVHGYSQDVSGGIGKMGDKLMAKTMDSLQESLTAAGNAVNADHRRAGILREGLCESGRHRS